MDKKFEEKYHEAESFHWWFLGRQDIIMKLLTAVSKDAAILDVGCSGGVVLQALKQKGFKNISGVDVSEAAISVCHQKNIHQTFKMDAQKLDWKDEQFDVIIASDVLEHIQEDRAALNEWSRVLKKDGILIVFVPAFQFLWSSYDTINNHFRRYTKSELIQRLTDAHFKICRSSYWNMFLFLPIALVRFSQKKTTEDIKKKATEESLNPSFNGLFLFLLRIENWILKAMNLPWGVSVFAIAKKTEK